MNLPRKGLLLVSIPLLSQLLFLAVLVVARRDQRYFQEMAIHSKEVIALAETAHRLIVEAQTHMRGYALGGEASSFVSSYDAARQRVPGAYALLLKEVKDNPEQVEKVEAMQAQADQLLGWLDGKVALVREGRSDEAVRRVQSLTGAKYLHQLRELTDDFLAEENRLDRSRRDSLAHAMVMQDLALLVGGALALASTLALLIGFSRSIGSRVAVLIDNTHRLAEGRELAKRLTGNDEISVLDSMFHHMAESIRQKDQENELFVYSVSHDLRSPLVNLQGFSQELNMVVQELRVLVLESALEETRKERAKRLIERDAAEAVGYIQTAVTRVAAIIDALLRLSRAGRVEYRPVKVEVLAVVNRVIKAMNDSMTRKQAEVTVHPLPSCWGDPTAIEQVFANLIGNAVNYLDPARQGKIEVGVIEEKGDTPFTTYFVKDNGLGIPEAQLPKVFVAFQRLHPNVAVGEGVGLALVRRVVERHGGTIWLESTPGVGTTFYVSLPCSPEGLPVEHPTVTPIPKKVTKS